MKKTLSILLALTLLLSAGAALAESPFTADAPGTLTVAVYDRSNMDTTYGDATNNFWTQWIQESVLADLNIAVEFMALPRSGSDDVLNAWMAGGNAPDIIFTYSAAMLYDYAEQGGLTDLSELIEQYGENIRACLGETLPYGNVSGGQYAIPAKRGDLGHLAAFIRKDWCEKVGHTLATNEDGFYTISYSELEEVMTQWKEQGICEYPMAILSEASTTEAESMEPFTGAFVDFDALNEKDMATLPNIMWPGVKDGYAWLNHLYNMGLIQPDWATYQDETEWKSWLSNGEVGVWAHAWWRELAKNEAVSALYANDPEAEVVAVAVTNDEGTPALIDQYAIFGMYIMVPVFSQHATEAVLYLDWMCDLDNWNVINYGFEGEHYELLESGAHDTSKVADDAQPRISVGDLAIVYNGNPTPEISKEEKAFSAAEGLVDTYMAAYDISTLNSYVPYDFGRTIVSEAEYGASLNEKIGELRVKAITCASEEFDATYDALLAEFLNMGGQEVIDEKTAAYEAKEAAQ
ncbi:MAG: extracellular solute-binding protein [Clostridiales bacterium]|nr:extracellular solute-binding protein [Clostridiales bacterium]